MKLVRGVRNVRFLSEDVKKQLLAALLCVLLVIAVIIVVAVWPSGGASAQTMGPVAAADDTERIAFLRSLGYEVTPPGTGGARGAHPG